MMLFEYKTMEHQSTADLADMASQGWRILQVGPYVDIGLRWDNKATMVYEWVLFERKVVE